MPATLFTGRHRSGKYLVRTNGKEPTALINWITTHRFRQFEDDAYRIDTHGRPRNRLYTITIPCNDQPSISAVMKMSFIHPAYKASRKMELFIHSLLKDYNKTAFHNICTLYALGLPVAEPLAFWQDRRHFFDRRSYLLYRKAPGKETVAEFYQQALQSGDDNVQRQMHTVLSQVIQALRKMHRAGFRYGDPHLNNILLDWNEQKPQICFIDYDHCVKTRVRLPIVKRFFDLKDVASVHAKGTDVSLTELMELYCGKADGWQYAAARFWRNGGFSLSQRFFPRSPQTGRHLKKKA